MIKCHLSRLMGERKLKISQLTKETDIHRNTLSLMYHETAQRIELDVIDKLCAYFKIPVGELFEYVPDPIHRPGSDSTSKDS